MLDANATSGADIIAFDIDGPGVHTIRPLSELPHLAGTTDIDGTTQPGYVNEPLVELSGENTHSHGLQFDAGSDGSTVRALVINRFPGVGLVIESPRNRIIDNYVGTTADGNLSAPNSLGGLRIFQGAESVITGNVLQTSIELFQAPHSAITGNFIGLNRAGTAAIGENSQLYVDDGSSFTTIGGLTPSERNIIVGSVAIDGGTGCVIVGNYIGTDVAGRTVLGFGGISLKGRGHRVGGNTASHRNVISGGIQFHKGTDHVVQGNFIGVAADGVTPIGGGGARIELFEDPISSVTIGDVQAGAGNVIDGSFSYAIGVTALSTRITIRGNSMIRTRGRIGIDLNRNGATQNDRGDADTGANMLQNYPDLHGSVRNGETVLDGTLNSTPSMSFIIDFYTNTDYGSGLNEIRWIGSTSVTTDATGTGTFTFSTAAPLNTLSATATDPEGNTSEFSPLPIDAATIPAITGISLLFLALTLSAVAVVMLRK